MPSGRPRFELPPIHGPGWRALAACLGLPTHLFYSERGSRDYEDAMAACESCPVRADCLEFALRLNDDLGIWGGLSSRGRRRYRRSTRVA